MVARTCVSPLRAMELGGGGVERVERVERMPYLCGMSGVGRVSLKNRR